MYKKFNEILIKFFINIQRLKIEIFKYNFSSFITKLYSFFNFLINNFKLLLLFQKNKKFFSILKNCRILIRNLQSKDSLVSLSVFLSKTLLKSRLRIMAIILSILKKIIYRYNGDRK